MLDSLKLVQKDVAMIICVQTVAENLEWRLLIKKTLAEVVYPSLLGYWEGYCQECDDRAWLDETASMQDAIDWCRLHNDDKHRSLR